MYLNTRHSRQALVIGLIIACTTASATLLPSTMHSQAKRQMLPRCTLSASGEEKAICRLVEKELADQFFQNNR